MTDPHEVGVDLYQLWVAGEVLLPRVAEVYEDNNQDIHNTGFMDGQAFDRFGQTSPIAQPWRNLRDTVQIVFGNTAWILQRAGWALRKIAADYAAVDKAAAAEMQPLINAYLRDKELPQPPGPLQVEAPGDPYKTEIKGGVEVPIRDDDD